MSLRIDSQAVLAIDAPDLKRSDRLCTPSYLPAQPINIVLVPTNALPNLIREVANPIDQVPNVIDPVQNLINQVANVADEGVHLTFANTLDFVLLLGGGEAAPQQQNRDALYLY